MQPVSGDLVMTAYLAVVVSPVPTSGALHSTIGHSADSGSAPRGAYSYSSAVPRPTPPRKRLNRASSMARQSCVRRVRSMRSRRPWNPCMAYPPASLDRISRLSPVCTAVRESRTNAAPFRLHA